MWKDYETDPPEIGAKIVILSNDGCSTVAGLVIDYDGKGSREVLDAEDGMALGETGFLRRAKWAHLPPDYVLAFTEQTTADWL